MFSWLLNPFKTKSLSVESDNKVIPVTFTDFSKKESYIFSNSYDGDVDSYLYEKDDIKMVVRMKSPTQNYYFNNKSKGDTWIMPSPNVVCSFYYKNTLIDAITLRYFNSVMDEVVNSISKFENMLSNHEDNTIYNSKASWIFPSRTKFIYYNNELFFKSNNENSRFQSVDNSNNETYDFDFGHDFVNNLETIIKKDIFTVLGIEVTFESFKSFTSKSTVDVIDISRERYKKGINKNSYSVILAIKPEDNVIDVNHFKIDSKKDYCISKTIPATFIDSEFSNDEYFKLFEREVVDFCVKKYVNPSIYRSLGVSERYQINESCIGLIKIMLF